MSRLVVVMVGIVLIVLCSSGTAEAVYDPLFMYPIDSRGVYVVDYGPSFGGLGVQYNPVSIANYALNLWSRYKATNEQKYLDRFLCQAKWLHDNQQSDGAWLYTFDIPLYAMRAPWKSCMAQGLGLQVESYAHQATGDASYLEKARRAIAPFTRTVQEGGVRSYFEDGTPWYEEYAYAGTPIFKVLNGYMFALQGIAGYIADNEDETATELLQEGLASLYSKIAVYDAGYISFYDAAGHVKLDYNHYHVEQLLFFCKLTENDRFRNYARRFDTYEPKKTIRADSLVAGQHDASLLVDGKRMNGNVWEKGSTAGYVQLDFGRVCSLDGINFFFADRRNVPASIQAATSADGKRWSNMVDSSITKRGAYYPADTKEMYIRMHYLKQPVRARYVRVVLNQGTTKRIRLREIHPLYNENPMRFGEPERATKWRDIETEAWYVPYLQAMEASGTATGYGDGTFRPANPVTRAELAALLCRSLSIPLQTASNTPSFADTASHWANAYIGAAGASGIVGGYPDGTFRPDVPVTRAEAATIIAKALTLPIDQHIIPSFTDVLQGYWAAPYIEAAKKAGVITGYERSVFNPGSRITRAEVAAVIVRATTSR